MGHIRGIVFAAPLNGQIKQRAKVKERVQDTLNPDEARAPGRNLSGQFTTRNNQPGGEQATPEKPEQIASEQDREQAYDDAGHEKQGSRRNSAPQSRDQSRTVEGSLPNTRRTRLSCPIHPSTS